MRRGDLVTAVLPRSLGKPRPALIVQADAFEPLPTVTILPLTSDLQDAHLVRVAVEPSASNGLELRSQVQVDKQTTVHRVRLGQRIGVLDHATLREVDQALSRFLGLT